MWFVEFASYIAFDHLNESSSGAKERCIKLEARPLWVTILLDDQMECYQENSL